MKSFTRINLVIAALAVLSITFGTLNSPMPFGEEKSAEVYAKQAAAMPKSYIIQGANAEKLSAVVTSVGGDVNKQFPIINAISAMLTPSQAQALKETGDIRVLDDRSVKTMSNGGGYSIDTYVSTQINANKVHDMGITGRGVTVAVIDSGTNMGGESGKYIFADSKGEQRVAIKYNAFESKETYYYNDDNNGHGSHVTGIIASSLQDSSRDFNGVAPDVYLVSVKAFDKNGNSSYSHILDALNWVAKNKRKFNIKVLNLSLGAEAQSRYWNDPINQAVMYLWYKGITVVTSAGNSGEELGVTVPGNNPYVITVGATTHNNSPYNMDDDRVASFSAKGPTYEGFVKPDLVAPGAGIAVKLEDRYLTKKLKKSKKNSSYSVISGTSQSAAVVSGVAALIIQAHPGIRPDDVKCKLIATAKAARSKNKKYAYSPLAQGSGVVNAYDAVRSNARDCANKGLKISDDLNGNKHFAGPVSLKNKKWAVSLSNGKMLNHGSDWDNGEISSHGAHWSTEVAQLEGAHWGNETMFLSSDHWSSELIETNGAHWGNESLELNGAAWSVGTNSHADGAEEDNNTQIPIEKSKWK